MWWKELKCLRTAKSVWLNGDDEIVHFLEWCMIDREKNHWHEEGRKLDRIGSVVRHQTFQLQHTLTCFTTTKQIGLQQAYRTTNQTVIQNNLKFCQNKTIHKRFLKRHQREQRVLCIESANSWLPWTVLQKDCVKLCFSFLLIFFIMPGLKSEKG